MGAQPGPLSDSNGLAAAALDYAAAGLAVFPCNWRKRAYTRRQGDAGQRWDATTDLETIRRWWKRWPRALIGLDVGRAGLAVLDYDPRNDGDGDGARTLARLVGDVETLWARTPAGGAHAYFRVRAGVSIRNSAGELGPGLDVRGRGGMVILPPSANATGRYEWVNLPDGSLPEIGTLPQAVIDALRPRYEAASRPMRWDAPGELERLFMRRLSYLGPLAEGRRNDGLFKLGRWFRNKGATPAEIQAALLDVNSRHCLPSLTEREVLGIAASASRSHAGYEVAS